MIELTPEQGQFLALLIVLISPAFQAIKAIVALPYLASFMAWISNLFKWLPGSSNDWQRVALYAFATAIARLFGQLLLPAFPSTAPSYTLPYATELLLWVEAVALSIASFIGLVTVVYHVLYKGLFKAADKANIPVLKELASVNIDATKAANS